MQTHDLTGTIASIAIGHALALRLLASRRKQQRYASAKNTAASCSIPASATASMATALPLRDESTCIRAGGIAIVAADELGQPAAGSKLRSNHSETGAAAGKAILPSDRHVSRPIHAESLSGPESDDSEMTEIPLMSHQDQHAKITTLVRRHQTTMRTSVRLLTYLSLLSLTGSI